MRPRLIAVDDFAEIERLYRAAQASMRPRLIAVDDERHEQHGRAQVEASMRPRLIAVDDVVGEVTLREYDKLQ